MKINAGRALEERNWQKAYGEARASLFLTAGLAIKNFARRGASREFPGFK
jgi:hypothetical protein